MTGVIDIVIPCAGRVDDLLRLLESLHRQAGSALQAQVASITVSDDRHSEALGQRVAEGFPRVRYVPGPARGPAANRNNGARQGQAPWLLFLDDDCFLDSDLLSAYAAARAARPDGEVFEGAIHAVGPRPNGNHHAPLNTQGGQLWSCNVLLRRERFESLGGFDERFPFACLEDNDLHLRLREAGARIAFAPQAAVLHPWRSVSEREITKQIISHAIYAQKHPVFARDFDLVHVARALAGRWRLYRSGRFTSIPLVKYRTVAYDVVAPVIVWGLMRLPSWRRRLELRHANRVESLR